MTIHTSAAKNFNSKRKSLKLVKDKFQAAKDDIETCRAGVSERDMLGFDFLRKLFLDHYEENLFHFRAWWRNVAKLGKSPFRKWLDANWFYDDPNMWQIVALMEDLPFVVRQKIFKKITPERPFF